MKISMKWCACNWAVGPITGTFFSEMAVSALDKDGYIMVKRKNAPDTIRPHFP